MFVNSKGATIINECLSSDGKRINLPNHIFEETYVAIDIGGSLAKVVYYDKVTNSEGSTNKDSLKEGHLNFAKFPTDDLDDLIKFLKTLFPLSSKDNKEVPTIVATGGGAHLFQERLEKELKVKIQKEDEMFCLIKGVDFFIREVPLEVFTYSHQEPMNFFKPPKNQYPYLLVNIGSGVSIIKVKGENDYERISGTSLGGGTFWGLLSLLTDCTSFDEMLELSKQGHNTNVDLLVGDIYGTDYSKIGLKSTTIASSMGKVFRKNLTPTKSNSTQINSSSEQMLTTEQQDPNFKPQDICASLLYMVSNNIGQIAYLNAKAHNIQYIYFGGFFIRGHPITMNTLSYAINFWSQGNMKALFLRHEGYLGSMGAFLKFNEN